MPETITREQLNEAINEFADKIMEALGATVTDEETVEPELTGTRFKAIDINGEEVEVNAVDVAPGTLLTVGAIEYFRCHREGVTGPWVRYTGGSYNNARFAEEMRTAYTTPRIVHVG